MKYGKLLKMELELDQSRRTADALLSLIVMVLTICLVCSFSTTNLKRS
jgi:hypothetical protein